MNWQLIDNVTPPKGRLLLVAFEDDNHRLDSCFATLKEDGRIYFADRPNDLKDNLSACRSEELEFMQLNADECPMFWSLFVWP